MKIRGGIPLDVQLESYTRSRSLRKVVVATVLSHAHAHTMTVHVWGQGRDHTNHNNYEKKEKVILQIAYLHVDIVLAHTCAHDDHHI